jgi:hypothetical protein
VIIEEARAGAGFDGNAGQCDLLAFGTSRLRGMEMIGHEIKISMADWRAELATPEKADRFARYCRRWFVVMPSDLAKRVKEEVPPTWGLLSVSGGGRVTELRAAKAQEPEEVPRTWWIGWLAQIDRCYKRCLPELVDCAIEAERERIYQAGVRAAKQVDYVGNLERRLAAFREATGVDLQAAWELSNPEGVRRLRRAWEMTSSLRSFDQLVADLRRVADALETQVVSALDTEADAAMLGADPRLALARRGEGNVPPVTS